MGKGRAACLDDQMEGAYAGRVLHLGIIGTGWNILQIEVASFVEGRVHLAVTDLDANLPVGWWHLFPAFLDDDGSGDRQNTPHREGHDGAAAAQAAAAGQLTHLRRLRAELQKQAALVQARLDAGDADRVELQNVRIDLAGSDATFLDAEAGVALASGQLEDALQVPFRNLSAVVAAPRDSASLSRTP